MVMRIDMGDVMLAKLTGKGTHKNPLRLEQVGNTRGIVGYQNLEVRPDGSVSVVLHVRATVGPDSNRAAAILDNYQAVRDRNPPIMLDLPVDLLPEDDPEV